MNKKPAWIAGLVGVVLMLLVVVGLILPKASAIRKKQQDVATAQAQMGTLQTQLQEYQAAKTEGPKNRRRLQRLETAIPAAGDLPGLIRELNSTADQTGLDWLTVAPSVPTPTGSVTEMPMQLTLVGGFFAVDQYLHDLETMPRVNTVGALGVTAGPDGLPQLQVVLTANFFTTDQTVGPGAAPDSSATANGG